MIILKRILIFVILLIPIIVMSIQLHIYKDIIDYKIISLVVTNFFGVLPATLCAYYTFIDQQNMILEFIPFYGIIFTSGSYHLCNQIQYIGSFCTILNPSYYMYLDFINSFICITTVILYLTKIEYVFENHFRIKIIMYLTHFIIISYLVIYTSNKFLPVYYTSSTMIPFLLVVAKHKTKYVEQYYKKYKLIYFGIGVVLVTIAFVAYVCTVYKKYQQEKDYWWLHSFLWHIPALLSGAFLLESVTDIKKSFFGNCFQIVMCNYFTSSVRHTCIPTDDNENDIELI
jgi:hypothetical protein